MSQPEAEPIILHAIDREHRLVRTTFRGPVDLAQIEEYMRQVDADPDYELDFDALVDLRAFTGEPSRDFLRRIAQTIRSNPGSAGARRALLVSSDLHFGLMRVLESLTFLAPVVYRVFRNEAIAMDWLAERWRKPKSPA